MLLNEIITDNGVYKYRPIEIQYGRKLINMEVCKDNLLDFKQLLDAHNVPFGIIFGTLLGAVRENNFIEHDEDVDVFILYENRELLLSLLFELRKIDFEVIRYDNELLSIMRNDDYIDIYIFKKNILGQRKCHTDSLSADFLDTFSQVWFLGEKFNTPNNYIAFLEKAYGKDWKVPKRNAPATIRTPLRKLLKRILPQFILDFKKK